MNSRRGWRTTRPSNQLALYTRECQLTRYAILGSQSENFQNARVRSTWIRKYVNAPITMMTRVFDVSGACDSALCGRNSLCRARRFGARVEREREAAAPRVPVRRDGYRRLRQSLDGVTRMHRHGVEKRLKTNQITTFSIRRHSCTRNTT